MDKTLDVVTCGQAKIMFVAERRRPPQSSSAA